ncbi:MAG: DUF3656 domain-containing protein, partial [Ruminiclostridium sp.]|nr:DUF3656 domain-containing protein [Ruminiclostridium sp.]
AAVTACRDVLAGRTPDTAALRAVFSRSGFTQAYYDGTLRDMQGIRTKDDVEAGGKALGELKRLYDKPYKRHTVDVKLRVAEGENVTAEVSCEDKSFRYTSDVKPERAVNRAVTAEEIEERLRKTGGTIYELGNVSVEVGEGVMLTASAINSVRREILNRLSDMFADSKNGTC